MRSTLGSLWNKWDLHIHTPFSMVEQNYGNSKETDIWEKFISDLEALPPEFKVIGINDYIFIDGYCKILKYKEEGRLKNIDLILPVVELRLNQFAGTESKLQRVNFHVIFSNELSPDIIKSQFLHRLEGDYVITPEHESIKSKWSGAITISSIEDLGRYIIDSVPKERRKEYKTPRIEGFNNLTLSLDKINNILFKSSYLKGKFLTAVGKTEWANMKWNSNSIADKKKHHK